MTTEKVVKLESGRYEYRGVRFGRGIKNRIVIKMDSEGSVSRLAVVVAKNLDEAKAIIDERLTYCTIQNHRLWNPNSKKVGA